MYILLKVSCNCSLWYMGPVNSHFLYQTAQQYAICGDFIKKSTFKTSSFKYNKLCAGKCHTYCFIKESPENSKFCTQNLYSWAYHTFMSISFSEAWSMDGLALTWSFYKKVRLRRWFESSGEWNNLYNIKLRRQPCLVEIYIYSLKKPYSK